jgi:hypothetical protein
LVTNQSSLVKPTHSQALLRKATRLIAAAEECNRDNFPGIQALLQQAITCLREIVERALLTGNNDTRCESDYGQAIALLEKVYPQLAQTQINEQEKNRKIIAELIESANSLSPDICFDFDLMQYREKMQRVQEYLAEDYNSFCPAKQIKWLYDEAMEDLSQMLQKAANLYGTNSLTYHYLITEKDFILAKNLFETMET